MVQQKDFFKLSKRIYKNINFVLLTKANTSNSLDIFPLSIINKLPMNLNKFFLLFPLQKLSFIKVYYYS